MAKIKIPARIHRLVKERAKGYCEYCLASSAFGTDIFPSDHVIPSSKDGSDDPQNLANACGICNGHKHDKTHAHDPLTNRLVPLYHPRLDKWRAHFQWNEDFTLMVGITPTGRATIDLLQTNRPANVNLRRLLAGAGLHPPKDFPD